jgi:SAM-dependent methyltransferase
LCCARLKWRVAFAGIEMPEHEPKVRRLIPPSELLCASGIGEGDYEQIGREFLMHLLTLASLKSNDQVLDIGCGIGRIATALTDVIAPPGRYEGFDVLALSVNWCAEHITPIHPHFRFQCIDVANSFYNPKGRLRGDRVRFPFPDSSFDLAVAISLYTHLRPTTALNYLRETRRVLRDGGRGFASFFVWNQDAEMSNMAKEMFPFNYGDHRVASSDNAEAAVAMSEPQLLSLYSNAGLKVTQRVAGTWAKTERRPPYQDLIVAVK